jgi:fermentation-respiration switch protein FrsA (DUF1100 family)
MLSRRLLIAVSTFAALAVASCGDDAVPISEPGSFEVTAESFTFVDDERATPAFGASPAQPTRTVVTDVWYPADAEGPFPLIVFNHGQQGEPQQYLLAFERWASAGYVVAAPRHPLTIRGGPGAQFVNDMVGEVGDVPFTISRVDDELGSMVDVGSVAVAGHSSGAVVAFAVGFNTCCHDDRVDAVVVESLFNVPFDGEYSEDLHGTPVLFVHGTADVNPIDQSRTAFDQAGSPKFLLAIEGGNHSEMYRDGPEAGPIADAALAFFDLTLKGDGASEDELVAIAGMQADPG